MPLVADAPGGTCGLKNMIDSVWPTPTGSGEIDEKTHVGICPSNGSVVCDVVVGNIAIETVIDSIRKIATAEDNFLLSIFSFSP